MKKVLFFLIVSPLFGNDFNLKWTIPDGINWYLTIMKGFDSNHDKKNEIIFGSESLLVPVIYELNGNIFSLVHVIDTVNNLVFFGAGEYDKDGLSDLLLVKAEWGPQFYLRVYESSNFYSYPDTNVWETFLDNMGLAAGFYIRSWGDLDGDDQTDIYVQLYQYFWIFENYGNNEYELVLFDSLPPPSRVAIPTVGDFDGDGKTEIVYGDLYGRVFVLENTGDNQFELVWDTTIYASMCYDNFSVDDADQDGKPEFVIHSYYYHPQITNKVWIFEATGDNSYEVVYLDTMVTPWTDDQGPISDAGDVDGDGIPELVISGTTAWYVLKATGDNQYERIFYYEPNPPEGWLIQLDIEIYDLDDNGLNDVITSWTWVDNGGWLHAKTEIFEKGIDMEWLYPSLPDTFLVDSVETLRWIVYDTISVESLYVYLTPLSNYPRDLIFQGEPLVDSTFQWTVPDSLGEFRLWLVVAGPGRRDSIASPTLFITATGVREKSSSIRQPEGLYPFHSNPLRPPLTLRYYLSSPIPEAQVCIVDVAGRVLRTFPRLLPGAGRLSWDGSDDRGEIVGRGVYFIILETERRRWVRRVLLWP